MTNSEILLDSSAWIAYFSGMNTTIQEIIDGSQPLFTSLLSLFEIQRKLLRDGIKESKVKEILSFIKGRSILLFLNETICEQAVSSSIQFKLAAMDSLIYATARHAGAELLTLDYDFKTLPFVKIV